MSTNNNPSSSDTSNIKNNSDSNIHQQELLDGLESLSVNNGKSGDVQTKFVIPALTPTNSVFNDDFDPITSSSLSNKNVILANSNNTKTDDELWSDFESFRENENNSVSSSAATKFDDWAKF